MSFLGGRKCALDPEISDGHNAVVLGLCISKAQGLSEENKTTRKKEEGKINLVRVWYIYLRQQLVNNLQSLFFFFAPPRNGSQVG